MSPETDLLDVIALDSRPDAVLHLATAQAAVADLSSHDVMRGGVWDVGPSSWRRYDRPWRSTEDPGGSRLLGTIYVIHAYPTPYETLLHRITVTPTGAALGWTPARIADDALACVDMLLADCPRTETVSERLPLVRV